jgi:uncharacterized protein
MLFEWNLRKAESNLAHHKIAFEDAVEVFNDPKRLELDVSRPEDGEWRGKIIGQVNNQIIVAVVYTDRAGITRIISARKASRDERERYNQSKNLE